MTTPTFTPTPTPTNTPAPDALGAGVYQFEDLTAPNIQLTSAWVIDSALYGTPFPDDEMLVSGAVDSGIVFYVRGSDGITIWRGVGAAACDALITVDGTPAAPMGLQYPFADIRPFGIPVNGNSQIEIVNCAPDGLLALDRVEVNGLLMATPTPAPQVAYYTVNEADEITGQFAYVATAGDAAIVLALLFLFFSFWAVFFIWLGGRDVSQ